VNLLSATGGRLRSKCRASSVRKGLPQAWRRRRGVRRHHAARREVRVFGPGWPNEKGMDAALSAGVRGGGQGGGVHRRRARTFSQRDTNASIASTLETLSSPVDRVMPRGPEAARSRVHQLRRWPVPNVRPRSRPRRRFAIWRRSCSNWGGRMKSILATRIGVAFPEDIRALYEGIGRICLIPVRTKKATLHLQRHARQGIGIVPLEPCNWRVRKLSCHPCAGIGGCPSGPPGSDRHRRHWKGLGRPVQRLG
jgi:hypothetical protein